MARNYKRDRKGRFAKVASAHRAAKGIKNKRLNSVGRTRSVLVTRGGKTVGVRETRTKKQVRSIKRHMAVGAAVGSVVPGPGTIAGAVIGERVGNRRKKNQWSHAGVISQKEITRMHRQMRASDIREGLY